MEYNQDLLPELNLLQLRCSGFAEFGGEVGFQGARFPDKGRNVGNFGKCNKNVQEEKRKGKGNKEDEAEVWERALSHQN